MTLKLEVEIVANDKASKVFSQAFDKSGRSAKKFEHTTSKAIINVQSHMSSLVKKVLAIGAAFASVKGTLDFSKSIIKTADTFEKLKLTLANIEGSMQKANASFQVIQNFAAKTPFDLEQVTAAFVKMKTYGIDPLSDSALRVVGDVASAFEGMGKTVDDVVEALADAQVGEFERLKEFGIKASKQGEQVILRYANAHGQMVEKVVDNNEQIIRSTLLAIWNDKYGGQMEKLSGTWTGMMSNLQDNWTRFKQLIANSGFFKEVKGKLKDLLDWSNKMFETGQAQKWSEIIGESLRVLVSGFSGAFKIMASTGKIIYEIGKSIVSVTNQIIKLHNTASDFWVDLGKGVWAAFASGINSLASLILKGAAKIYGFLEETKLNIEESVIAPVVAGFDWLWDRFKYSGAKAINWIADSLIAFSNKILKHIPWLREKSKEFIAKFKVEVEAPRDFKDILGIYTGHIEDKKKKLKKDLKDLNNTLDNFFTENSQYWEEWGRKNSKIGEIFFNTGKTLKDTIANELLNIKNVANNTSKSIEDAIKNINEIAKKPLSAFKPSGTNEKSGNNGENDKPDPTFWDNFIKGVEKSNVRLAKMFELMKSIYEKAKNLLKGLNWDKIKSIGSKVWSGIKNAFSGGAKEGETGIVARVKNAFSNITQGATAGGIIGAGAAFLTDQLMQNEKIRKAMDKIFEAIQKIIDPVAEVIAPVIESIGEVIIALKPIFKIVAESMKPIAWFIRRIADGIAKVINFFTNIAKPIWEGMKKGIDLIKKIVKAIAKALKAVKKGASDIVDNTIGKIFKGIGRALPFHTGGAVKPLIAHDGMYIGRLQKDEVPAVLQSGEYVVNRQATQKYRPVLEAINQGKDIGTNITVNVYAKNFDRKFVEDELVPILENLNKRGKLRWE